MMNTLIKSFKVNESQCNQCGVLCTENVVFHKDFFSKCDQIPSKLWIWSHLLKKCIKGNFIFCAVVAPHFSTVQNLLKKILRKDKY